LKTEDLVTMLATGAVAVDRNSASRRYLLALVFGVLGSGMLMAAMLGVRPDLATAVRLPMFWVKFVFVAVLALAGGVVTWRLSHPGSRVAWTPCGVVAPVIVMWVLAAYVLASADPTQRYDLIYGRTSAYCPFLVAMLAVPVFVAVTWAMHGLAPTHLRLAGGAAGSVSGALGAVVYTLHCPEMAAPFVGLWYLLGILIPTVVGVLLGPRLLRW